MLTSPDEVHKRSNVRDVSYQGSSKLFIPWDASSLHFVHLWLHCSWTNLTTRSERRFSERRTSTGKDGLSSASAPSNSSDTIGSWKRYPKFYTSMALWPLSLPLLWQPKLNPHFFCNFLNGTYLGLVHTNRTSKNLENFAISMDSSITFPFAMKQ